MKEKKKILVEIEALQHTLKGIHMTQKSKAKDTKVNNQNLKN